jgi:tetratricopeptide (TPR) repeat protein
MEREEKEQAVSLIKDFRDVSPVECTEKLIEIYKKHDNAEDLFHELVTLGDLLSEMDSIEDSMNAYKEALGIIPDSDYAAEKIAELEDKLGISHKPGREAKSLSEKLVDADIFVRYGLMDEAKDILESLKVEESENIEVHRRLKDVYIQIQDDESAITECLILSSLYEKGGDLKLKDDVLREALGIDDEDPRLVELAKTTDEMPEVTTPEQEILGPSVGGSEEEISEPLQTAEVTEKALPEGVSTIEDFSEELSEAEFYERQGLYQDALSIYDKVSKVVQHSEELEERMEAARKNLSEEERESRDVAGEVLESPSLDEIAEPPVESEVIGGETSIEEEPAEPTLDSEVLEIFDEFKKGLSAELEDKDYETHYNLGIAYKEMGLIDDAIKEFQLSKADPERRIQVLSMLGMCYMEKKLYSLAVDAFREASDSMEARDDSYWGTIYALAEAHEKSGDTKTALDLFVKIYGWNSKFRNVHEKVNLLKQVLDTDKSDVEVIEETLKTKKDRISYI